MRCSAVVRYALLTCSLMISVVLATNPRPAMSDESAVPTALVEALKSGVPQEFIEVYVCKDVASLDTVLADLVKTNLYNTEVHLLSDCFLTPWFVATILSYEHRNESGCVEAFDLEVQLADRQSVSIERDGVVTVFPRTPHILWIVGMDVCLES